MIREKIQQDFPLAPLSTFKIGGAAEFFVVVATSAELEEAVAWAKEQKKPVTVLGGGSNILVNDSGVRGLVIKVGNEKLEFGDNRITCGASTNVWDVAQAAFEHGLAGMEWSIGIPGSMGGAIRGNAGAHGGSFDKIVGAVTVFDTDLMQWQTYPADDCAFAYRSSRFKSEPHYVIWEVTLDLVPGDKQMMAEAIAGYKQYRRDSQPKEPSAGCIFKNFFADDIKRANLELYARAEADKKIRGGKIGAGYLVQQLGLMGHAHGGAKISDQHANFIVNASDATASDVVALIADVKQRIRDRYNVELEEEVQYIGF